MTERPTVYRFERQGDTWAKREVAFASERKLARIQGRIEQGGTLSLAVDQLGEFPTLVNEFDRLFGWQMDFYRQQRVGDEFAMLVEKIYIDGVFREYGRVLSGLYQSKVHGPLLGFKMKQGPGFGVFDEKTGHGASLLRNRWKCANHQTTVCFPHPGQAQWRRLWCADRDAGLECCQG